MKKINLFSRLWSSGGNSQSSDVGSRCRVVADLLPSFCRVNMLKLVSVLVLILTIGVGQMWGTEYQLCTSVSDLVAGAKYVIGNGASGSVKFMSTTSETNYRHETSAQTVTNNKVTATNDMLVLTLGGSTGQWTFYTYNYAGTDGYLASAASGSNNYCRVIATSTTCTISISSNVATIALNPHSSRKYLKYNSGSTRFACYSSGQSAVYLYKEVTGGGCDKEVTLAQSVSNCTATFTPSGPVKTCSATASDRQVSVSITPTTGYALTSGPTVSGIASATISGSGPYTIQLPQNGNGTLTLSATCTAISVTGVSLNKSSTTIVEGNTETLTATVTPSNALDKAVTWSSGTPGVATVNSSGVVTAVSAGNATITVTTHDGSFTANCTVTVTAAARDHFIDAMHSTSGYTGDGMEKVGNYSASIPSIADKAKNTTGTCQEKHYHFTGWVTAANRANPEGNLVTLDGNASNTTYYAVWTKEAAGGASGTESVSWSSRYNSTTNVEGTELTIETNVTVTHNKGSNNNACQYYTTGPGIRVYGGGNFVVEAPSAITAITLTFGTGDGSNTISADVGTYSNGSWSGSATTVTFSVGGSTGHRRIAGISVTYGGGTSYEDPKTSCTADPIDPTVTFSNGEYTVGGSALDLRTLWTSNSSGAVTYTVTNANGTEATIAGDGYSLSATTAGSCTVQASQAAVPGVYNAISRTATITVNPPTCATPTFDNGTNTYNNDVTVTISCATGSSTIHYTTGVSPADPTCSSGSTGTSVTINATGTTLKAVACKDGYNVSAVASATYTLKCATPTISVAAGTYSSAQSVTLACTTDGATIKYTTDGRDPATYGTTYSSAITISDDATLKVVATKTNYVNSDLASAAYKIMDCDWYESFDTNDGTDGCSGTNAGASFKSDHDGWSATYKYGGAGYARFGKSSTASAATTPTITGLTGDLTLKFRARAWDSEGGSMSLSVSDGTLSSSSVTITSCSWDDYNVTISDVTEDFTITFQGPTRYFLDEVCVKGPSSFTVSFDANGHGTAPDPITDVAKNATISKPTPDPSATGWTFGGWYKESTCDNAWNWATDQVTSNTTLWAKWTCSNPTSLSISETNSKGDFCPGESMTLTAGGTGIGDGATYLWKVSHDGGSSYSNASGTNNASTYSVASMTLAHGGKYTCTISNGSCSTTSSAYDVKVWCVHINNGAAGAYQDIAFTNTGTGTGTANVALDADQSYGFKLWNNNGASIGWYGLDSKTITTTESNITLNSSGANVGINAGLGGTYVFTIDYTSATSPKVSVTYPVGNQPSGRKIWFDKSVITDWTDAGTSDLVWRIGKKANSMTNKDDPANAFTLVPGTDRFYVYETKEYIGFEAWHVANNVAWSGNSDNAPAYDNHSIYTHYHDQSSTDVKYATVYQKYVIGTSGVTLVPTTKKNTDWYCDFWNVTKTDGMLTHTATITPPTNGTITIANAAQSLEETTTTADLPHRTRLTVTATPAPGYQLSSLTVNGEAFTSGNEHILSADATIAATFTAKTITITWNENGGNTPSPTESSYTYNGSTVSLATVTHATKLFAGWFTDPSAGTQITEIGTTNKPTADVTYYAHWVDGNTVYFNPGAGTVTPASATQTSIGGSVSLPTPTPTCDGWTFQGWKVGSTQTEVTELPAGLVTGSYVPESATVQMYAVYKKTFDETAPQSVTVDWEASSGYLTGWSTTGSWSRATRSTNHAGLVAASATLKYNTKVAVKSVSAKFMRESNNTAGAFMFEKSTDGVNWSDVDTDNWHTPDEATKNEWFSFGYAQKDGFFDGATEYYIRLNFTTSGSADRLFDDITITYNATSSVTHYATSPLECAQVATPVITPEGDNYTGAQSITITCATDGATIRYTTDGTNPSKTVGTVIASGSSFTLSCSGTVKAIAYKDGMADSDIASETYTIKVPDPTFSPDGGDFKVAQSVSISDALAGTTVYYEYTTDGSEPSDPTASSTAYSSTPIPVAVGQTVRIKAIGINACCSNSDIVSKTFRVGWDFELVTNEDDLNVGDKIVVLSGSTNALSTYNEASYNRTATSDFDLSGTTVTAYPPSTNSATTVQVITLDGEPGNWKLKTTNTKWFNCPSAGRLTTVTTEGSTAEEKAARKWSIDIGSSPNYYAIITNNNVTDATIQYGTVFAAYASDQFPVKIYSIPNPDPLLKVEGTLSAFAGCTSEASAAQSFYVSGKNLSASIRVTAPTGYEVSLSSGSGYADYIDVARVGTAVSKTQVYVRLKAGDAGAVAANNVVVSVSDDDLSQNVAIPASSISAADTYIDRMHGASTTYKCGSYSAPNLSDFDGDGTDCEENYAIFQGWVAADQINLDGTLKAGATVISSGTAMTASGTTYYSIWEALVE